jgi:2-polyprenyl-3-methyl-5-hydroxy-6-metoxy-1,4-benzoquinol methylase
MEIATVYVGDRLGLYRALAKDGPSTAAQLAAQTGTHERYVREWVEQQAVAGILEVEDYGADAAARRYRLSPGHAEVLLARDSLNYLAPLARAVVGLIPRLPELLDAFRSGSGVPYRAYGADTREGQAELNRPAFLALLGQEWLPALPDVHARLQANPPARIADIGCGLGWSSIAIAQAYPKVRVDGFDSDEASIEAARKTASEAGLSDRVTFQLRDATDPTLNGRYDLVTMFEVLHDMARPVEALRVIRGLLAEGGAVLVADMQVADAFTVPGDDGERLCYASSVLFCLPTGMAEQPSAGTGTVMRTSTLRGYAHAAGFRGVEILPTEFGFWRFYRLIP